jgi:hypothetical protein
VGATSLFCCGIARGSAFDSAAFLVRKRASALLAGYKGMKQREATVPVAGKVFIKEDGERATRLYIMGKPKEAVEWRNTRPTFHSKQKVPS